MKENVIELDQIDGMAFRTEVDGHEIILDAEDDFGGKDRGPRPKALVLVALLGCTGMDVASLLDKMRVEYDDFKLKAVGRLTDEHPKYYDKITMEYHIWGSNVDKAKMEKAVALSTERYCGVHHMLEKSSEVEHSIIYHD